MFLRCRRSCTQLKDVHAATLVAMAPAGFSLEPSQLRQLYAHPCKQSMWFSTTLLLPVSTHIKPRHVVIWVSVPLPRGWGPSLSLGRCASLSCRVLQGESFLSGSSSIWQKMLKRVLCFRKSESDRVPW